MDRENVGRDIVIGAADRRVLTALVNIHGVDVVRAKLQEIESHERAGIRDGIASVVIAGVTESAGSNKVMDEDDGQILASLISMHGSDVVEANLIAIKQEEDLADQYYKAYLRRVEGRSKDIEGRLKGQPDSITLWWDVIRRQLAQSALAQLNAIIHSPTPATAPILPIVKDKPFGGITEYTNASASTITRFITSVRNDLFEWHGDRKPYDITDLDAFKNLLADEIRVDGSRFVGSDLQHVEIALKIAALNARYKFAQWHGYHDGQITSVLNAYEDLVAINPAFNPDQAGFPETKELVMSALVSIQIDFNSKPHDRYVEERFLAVGDRLKRMLGSICVIEAKLELRRQNTSREQPEE